MSRQDHKIAILRQLGQESEPISLSHLLSKLGQEFKERTVRRWLQQLVNDGVVERIGNRKGTKYLIIGRSFEPASPISSCFSSASLTAIKQIKRPVLERVPVTYVEEWLTEYCPNKTYFFSAKIRQELLKAGQRMQPYDPAGTYAHQIFHRLLIDLSYNSSRLEGNTYSLLDTERLLLHGDSPEGKLDEEKVMILNHKEAIRYLVDTTPQLVLSRDVICTLHYLLADGLVESNEAGKIRRHPVRIGGSVYLPFEEPTKLSRLLEKITTKATSIQDPFEQSLFLLIHLSYLQAFADVNKRTARLAANLPLVKNNLVPLAFNDIQVSDYLSAMIALYELQDVHPVIDLYVYSYMRTCAAYDVTVKAMGFDEVRVRYRGERRRAVREIILGKFVGHLMQEHVAKIATTFINPKDHIAFVEDVLEDIQALDHSRLVGLGVTPEELDAYINLKL